MKKLIYLTTIFVSVLCAFVPKSENAKLTTVEGHVRDAASGEIILFATVAFYKDDSLIGGIETDLEGKYSYQLEPGTYDIEAHYVGYTHQKLMDVHITEKGPNVVDFNLNQGVLLDEIVVVKYEMPLIELDHTTSGATVTAEAIRSLPKKSTNAIAAMTAGSKKHDSDSYSTEESYAKIVENKPISPFNAPLSTFAIDVDRASYSNIRRFINQGQKPPKDAVRIEEMINYFNYDYPEPKSKRRPVEIFSQLTPCPWNEENKILHIGLQGKKIKTEDLPKSNLVFLIDVSGSMNSMNKLPLVKESFKLLVNHLRTDDHVAIVTYAGAAGILLESTSAAQKEKIIEAIESLGAGGSTAGAQGIRTAYNIARKNFKQDGNNRVILATDGDFNVGLSSNDELLKLIEKERNSGVFLSVLGFGMGNYKDDKMQILADAGNGNHAYIDGIDEAKKTLITEFGGTMFTIAKDVKVQVEFNPAYVGTYRLIGYENRLMKAEEFRDDTKDAGEIGAGHSVTALYEISPPDGPFATVDDRLLYQKRSTKLKDNNELATIRVRYKTPGGHKAWEFDRKVGTHTLSSKDLDDRTKQAMAIAEFGMLLRDSRYKEDASYSNVDALLQEIESDQFLSKDVIDLVRKAEALYTIK